MASGWRGRIFSIWRCRFPGRPRRISPAPAFANDAPASSARCTRDPETHEAFSDQQLGDEVATMILAGHETTATALFWSLYLLALDPATQDQLAAEVANAVASGALDIERLKFTRAVVDETMRLYPPAFLIARAAAAPDTIAGLPVRKNDVVLIAPWLLHRHEKLWRDPNAFIPARFMPPSPPPDRFAYLPFGVGARVC